MTNPENIWSKGPEEIADYYTQYSVRLQANWAQNNLLDKWRKCYNAYYGRYFKNQTGLGINEAGDVGEYVITVENQLRNIIKHIITLTTENRLVFDSMASNSDVKSMHDAIVGNAVLDQLFYEKKYERVYRMALELSLIMGTSILYTKWNPYDKLMATDGDGNPVFAGTPKICAKNMLDIIWEPNKEDASDHDYVIIKERANRWDLLARYPQHSEKIMALPSVKRDIHFLPYWQYEENEVWVFEAYHKPTTALPYGRYLTFCQDGLWLEDMKNPYSRLPIFVMRPDIVYGSSYGHTVMFDLFPVQEAHNLLNSTILSNQLAFGNQQFAAPKEAGIQVSQLGQGFSLHEYDVVDGAPNGGMPQIMQLLATPQELFAEKADKVGVMEQLSGVNSAARGNPSTQLVSGTAIALVTTQANTFNNNLEQTYTTLVEESAYFLLEMCSKFMKVPELLSIAGINNRYSVMEYTGENLKSIKRVRVTLGNPLSRTLAGKLEIANNLLMNQMLNAQEYLEILRTGQLAQKLESSSAQLAYMQEENQALAKGEEVHADILDNHQLHLKEHQTLKWRLDIRKNSELLALLNDHIQEHLDMIQDLAYENPMVLALALEQPLPLPASQGVPGYGQPPEPAQQASGVPGAQGAAPEPMGGQTADSALSGGAESVAQSGMRRAEKQLQATE